MDTKWLSTLLVAMVLAAAALASERELSFDGDDNSYAEDNNVNADDLYNQQNIYSERNPFRSLLVNKRSNAYDFMCGRWDDWCQQGTSRPGLSCCPGYQCKCHLLWNSNCKCRSRLFGGR